MEIQPLINQKGKLVFNCGHSLKDMAMQSSIINNSTISRCLICDNMQEFPSNQLALLKQHYPGEFDQVFENIDKLFEKLVLPPIIEVFYGDKPYKIL